MPKVDDDCRSGDGKEDDRDGGKLDDSGPSRGANDTKILDRVLELMLSSGMEHDFEDFAKQYIDEFMEAAKTEDEDSVEYTLAHTEIYNKYLNIFEKKISDYIEGEGFSLDEFYAQCRGVLEKNDFEDPRKYFIEALLATTEFPIFFQLMVGEAKIRILTERQAGMRLDSASGK